MSAVDIICYLGAGVIGTGVVGLMVAAFFKANPKQPRKKRTFPPEQQGEPMSGELGLIEVRATGQGEVRWTAAGPLPDEIRYGTIVRGMSPAAARELAADLVRAANEAEAQDG